MYMHLYTIYKFFNLNNNDQNLEWIIMIKYKLSMCTGFSEKIEEMMELKSISEKIICKVLDQLEIGGKNVTTHYKASLLIIPQNSD